MNDLEEIEPKYETEVTKMMKELPSEELAKAIQTVLAKERERQR